MEAVPETPQQPRPRPVQVDWDTCRDPYRMVLAARAWLTGRKLRLYACAAARRIWPLLTDPRTRAAVEVAEQYAEGLATPDDLRAANDTAWEAFWEVWQTDLAVELDADPWWYGMLRGSLEGGPSVGVCASDPELAVWPEDWDSSCLHFLEQLEGGVRFAAANAVAPMTPDTPAEEGLRLKNLRDAAAGEEMVALVRVVRCLFPDPDNPVPLAPGWRTPTAVSLARRMYDSRDFSALPILADAFQDAGCDHPDVLAHCHDPGPHVRGCWVIDQILGLA